MCNIEKEDMVESYGYYYSIGKTYVYTKMLKAGRTSFRGQV